MTTKIILTLLTISTFLALAFSVLLKGSDKNSKPYNWLLGLSTLCIVDGWALAFVYILMKIWD